MMTEEIKEQIEAVRRTGEVNMFDCNGVQCVADEMEFYELVIYIQENRKDYWDYIIGG